MFRIDSYLAVRVVHCVYRIDIGRLDFVGVSYRRSRSFVSISCSTFGLIAKGSFITDYPSSLCPINVQRHLCRWSRRTRVKMFTDAPEKSTYRSPPLLASRIDGSGYQQFWPTLHGCTERCSSRPLGQ